MEETEHTDVNDYAQKRAFAHRLLVTAAHLTLAYEASRHVLESPAIKVKERKALNCSQSEETTIKDNPSQPLATEPQPLPSAPNPTQRPICALHKLCLQQQPS